MNNRTSGGFVLVSINYLLICFLPLFFFWSDGGLAFSRHLVAMHLWWLDFFSPWSRAHLGPDSWCLVTCSFFPTWFPVVSFGSLLCCAVLSHCCVQLFATPCTVARQAPLSMGILLARILEWVTMPCSRGSSQPRDPSQVSHISGGFFTVWATREALGSQLLLLLLLSRFSRVRLYGTP